MKTTHSVALVAACILCAGPLWSLETAELELVEGPKMVNLSQKGAMLRVMQVEKLMVDRAHQLRFTFFPAIKDSSIKVKLYRDDDTSQVRDLMLRGGRSALVDLDPGPGGLHVMIEEQGRLEQSTRIFASLYRYPAGGGSVKTAEASSFAAPPPPEPLVKAVDILETTFKGDRRAMRRTLAALSLTEDAARSFVVAMANVRAYLGRQDFTSAEFFLGSAERVLACAEILYWRALAFGIFDLDKAQKNIQRSLELFDAGHQAAALFGDTPAKSRARSHMLAANLIIRQTQARPRKTDDDYAESERALNGHLAKAAEHDPSDSKEPAELLRRKWREVLEARNLLLSQAVEGADDGGVPLQVGVRDFLEARRHFVEKKYSEALKILDTVADLPAADSQYLRAEILLQLGRREGARKALEKSIVSFEAGRCLAGKEGGAVSGAHGMVPPATARAALARVSLARYWAERFKRERTDEPTKAGSQKIEYLERAIALMEKALEEAPSHTSWQSIVNTYRDERLRTLYPGYAGATKR